MGNNNNDNNNTIKIISWNVNQFCKMRNWAEYKEITNALIKSIQWPLSSDISNNYERNFEETKNKMIEFENNRHLSFNDVTKNIISLLKAIKPDVLFLNEVPYSSRNIMVNKHEEYIIKLKKELNDNDIDYIIETPEGKGNFITIAMIRNNVDYEVLEEFDKNIPFGNRRLFLNINSKNKSLNVFGIHMNYKDDETSLKAWKYLLGIKKVHIIIGDLNVDNEGTDRWKKYMKKLLKNYSEPETDAARKEVGKPKTYYGKEKEDKDAHLDYALVRKDIEDIVDSYTIIKKLELKKGEETNTIDFGKLSDHYPIMLEINLNNDKEEA